MMSRLMRAAQAMQQQTRRVAMGVLVRVAATIRSSWLRAPLRAASLSAGASKYLAAVSPISARAKRARKTDAAGCIPSALAAARLPAPMHAQTAEILHLLPEMLFRQSHELYEYFSVCRWQDQYSSVDTFCRASNKSDMHKMSA